MEIIINSQPRDCVNDITISTLLGETIGSKQNGIAVAVNDMVIPKSKWESFELKSHDTVLIIKATQGG